MTQTSRPNAVAIYERAYAEALRTLPKQEGQLNVPYVDDELDKHIAYTEQPWPGLVEKSALARNLFEQAAAIRECRFAPEGSKFDPDFNERLIRLMDLRRLVIAHAWQRIEKQPADTLQACRVLLAHARHLGSDAYLISTLFRIGVEGEALELCDAVLERHNKNSVAVADLKVTLAAIDDLAKTQPTPALLADKATAEARHWLTSTLEETTNREAVAAVIDRTIELTKELTAPMKEVRPEGLAKYRNETKARIRLLKNKYGKQKMKTVLESGSGEALAAALATVVAPDTVSLLESLFEANDRRQATLERLRARLGINARAGDKGKGK